jgi:hypothetical protein
VSKDWKPNKKTVELEQPARPSRIRREPVPVRSEQPTDLASRVWWQTEEWEVPLAIAGILLFAIAVNALWFGINQILSH